MNVDFLERLASAPNDDAREQILLGLTWQRLDQDLRDAIRAAAVPHWFDAKSLATLLETDTRNADRLYQGIAALPYVEPHSDRGLALRERTRRVTLAALWRDERTLY